MYSPRKEEILTRGIFSCSSKKILRLSRGGEKEMKRRLFSLFGILIITALVITACKPATEEAPAVEDEWGLITYAPGTKVKIGVSSALAGGYAVYGQDMLNGVDLAIADFGDLKGFEVVSEGGDDGCEGAPAVTVAEQFAADPTVVAVVGPMCSGSVVPASDIYSDHHIVMVTPSSTAVIVTARGYENIFRIVANDDLQAKVTSDYLRTELDIATLAILHDQSIYGQGVAEAVHGKFEAAGGNVTAIEGITRGDTDFSAVISTILADSPEAVYWGGMDAEGALIISQLRSAGFEGVFFGPDGIKSKPSYIDASGGAAEGSYATFGAVGGATGYDDWEARFTELYDAPVAYGPGSYDAAMIILQAAAAVAEVDGDGNLVIGRKALADQIRATPYNGITGALEFTNTGDLSKVSITVFKVENGDFVEVKKVDFGG
jgi:branched-chain amino acid transport system substrate-binding protein